MQEDPTAANTASSPTNVPADPETDPRQKVYETRRRNRRLGWSMDQLKNGCKGLIAADSETTFVDEEVLIVGNAAIWATKLLKEIEMMEAELLKVGNIYAHFIPTKEDNDPSIFNSES
jgi:hypothetical protein